jgi:hypothetical protein
MKHGYITSIQNQKRKTEHAVGAPRLIPSEEIKEVAISREDECINFLG